MALISQDKLRKLISKTLTSCPRLNNCSPFDPLLFCRYASVRFAVRTSDLIILAGARPWNQSISYRTLSAFSSGSILHLNRSRLFSTSTDTTGSFVIFGNAPLREQKHVKRLTIFSSKTEVP